MQRGKTDKVDAQPVRRCGIAQYAYGTGHPALSGSDAPLGAATRGYSAISLSDRAAGAVPPARGLIRRHGPPRYNLLSVPVTEQETFIRKSLQKTLKWNVEKSLTALKAEQKAVDNQIHQLIQADPRLKDGAARAVI